MTKYLRFFIAIVSMSAFVACSNDDDFTPPNYVTFGDVTVLSDEMTVSVEEQASETIELPVYTSTEAGSARTFDVVVDESSTLDPSAYSIPETVTVPANSNEAMVTVEITGSGINNEGDVLVLRLQEEPNLFVGDPLTINLIKVCPYDASPWIGTYDVEEAFTGGSNEGLSLAAAFGEAYQVELVENPGDATNGSLIMNNSEGFNMFFEDGTVMTFGACAGTIMLSNGNIADFADLTITDSSYDETSQTITVEGELGTYGPYQFVLTRQTDAGEGTDGEGTDGEGTDGEGTDGDTDTSGE